MIELVEITLRRGLDRLDHPRRTTRDEATPYDQRMTWLFAVIIVAVMGGIAVVAAGHGGSMAETYDDRPDARIPADGPLTSSDLRRVRFSTAFRGYRMSEVDALLDRLAAEMDPPRQAAGEGEL